MAAFEAVGYAKFSGKVGVCMATSGPGAIHLLNGLYDAKLDHVPVLAIVGQTDRDSPRVAPTSRKSTWSACSRTCATSTSRRLNAPAAASEPHRPGHPYRPGHPPPTCIIVPYDVQELDWEPPGHEFKMVPSSLGIGPGRRPTTRASGGPRRSSTPAKSRHPGRPRRPRGAPRRSPRWLTCSAPEWPRRSSARTSSLTTCPWVTGSLGLLGTRPSYELMMDCDTLLTVGSELPLHPVPAPARPGPGHPDRPRRAFIGMRYPYEVNLVADASSALQALLPLLTRKDDRSWRETVEGNVSGWWDTDAAPGHDRQRQGRGVNPATTVLGTLRAAPANAIVAVRLRLVSQLVRPAPEVRHHRAARVAVGDAGHHGARRCPT